MIRLLWFEILSFWRGRMTPVMSVGVYLLLNFLMGYAMQNDPAWDHSPLPGLAFGWVAMVMSSLLALDAVWQDDARQGVLLQQQLSPWPFSMIIMLKVLAFYLTIIAPLTILLSWQSGGDMLTMLAGLTGGLSISVLIVMAGALTLYARRGALLISFLVLLPLLIPPLTFGLGAQIAVTQNTSPWPALSLLGATTLFTVVLAPLATYYSLHGQRH